MTTSVLLAGGQKHEVERASALETEWRRRESERAAQAALADSHLARLEAKARKVRQVVRR